MEPEGLKRCLKSLTELPVTTVATDRHIQIGSLMKTSFPGKIIPLSAHLNSITTVLMILGYDRTRTPSHAKIDFRRQILM